MNKKLKAEHIGSAATSVATATEICNPYASIAHESVPDIIERFRWITEEMSVREVRKIMIDLGRTQC